MTSPAVLRSVGGGVKTKLSPKAVSNAKNQSKSPIPRFYLNEISPPPEISPYPEITPCVTSTTFSFSPNVANAKPQGQKLSSAAENCDPNAGKSTKNLSTISLLVTTPRTLFPQRRKSDQDRTPSAFSDTVNARSTEKKYFVRPLRASPLFSDTPYFGSGTYSATKVCDALVQSPCRSESFRRQRRRLYHRDEFEEDTKKRKFSLSSVGNIECTPKIGKGGFGSVYIGKYDGNIVAIKQLCNSLRTEAKGESLCAELSAFRLIHPNIVKIITFSCSGSTIQIVFEYVGRRNLLQLLENSSENLEFERRLLYCRQIADALRYCHENRVLHLDIKAANVLLTDDGTQCKLADFGCSRLLSSVDSAGEPVATPRTSSSAMAGTLIFKAPEVLRGVSVTSKADVYSYGFLVWHCVTRRPPFDGMNPQTVAFCVVAQNLRPKLSDEAFDALSSGDRYLLDLAEKCWQAAPENRPDFDQIVELLHTRTVS